MKQMGLNEIRSKFLKFFEKAIEISLNFLNFLTKFLKLKLRKSKIK